MKVVSALLFLSIMMCIPAYAAQQQVLVDEGHGQRFRIDSNGPLDLSAFATILRDQGLSLAVEKDPLNEASLAGAGALIISGAFRPLSAAEITAVRTFVENGGRLVVMLHVGNPVAPLIQSIGVDVSNGVIREKEGAIDDHGTNFSVTRFADHPLLAGMTSFIIYGGWALDAFAGHVTSVAATSPEAWIDLDGDGHPGEADATGSFGVIVAGTLGAGKFVVIGDDAIFQNKFLSGGNRRLAENLAEWLNAAAR